jgi:hypothetical protein
MVVLLLQRLQTEALAQKGQSWRPTSATALEPWPGLHQLLLLPLAPVPHIILAGLCA